MATIVTRSGKGSPLTNAEVDANFTNLNSELGSHTHDGRYYTESEADSRFVNTDGDTVTGLMTFTNMGNKYNGHLYYTAYDAAGNHYPHFLDGTNATGVNVNWRVYSGSNLVVHNWRYDYTNFANSLRSGVDVRAPIFYDSNNTAYYVDPASNTNLYNIVSHLMFFRGKTSAMQVEDQSSFTRIAFNELRFYEWDSAGDTFTLNGGYGQFRDSVRAPIFYDSANTSFYWNPNESNGHRFQTPSGYVRIGPQNTSHCHFDTDRSNFYFNTNIRVNSGLIDSYDEDLQLRRASNASHRITIGAGTTTVSQNTVVEGTVQHNGLVMTSGTNVDQLYTHTKSLTLTTSWQDTGVQAGMLPGGTYIVQVYAADSGVGGGQYYETYSGVMTWYSGDTNDTSWDEIPLHSAGHADSDRAIYLRTLRTATADTRNMVLQIAGDGNNTAAYTYTFKFRRMI